MPTNTLPRIVTRLSKIAHEMTNAKPDDTRAEFIYDQALPRKAN
jgi:hypothetical protein